MKNTKNNRKSSRRIEAGVVSPDTEARAEQKRSNPDAEAKSALVTGARELTLQVVHSAARLFRKLPAKRSAAFPLLGTSAALNILLMGAAALMVGTAGVRQPLPAQYPLEKTLEIETDRQLVLLDATGREFARRGGCVAAPVKKSELPDHFVDALLSTEDRRFYDHLGVDLKGIVRAAIANYSAGRIVQGGSTITQQLAKTTYLSGVRTIDRKLEEALIAVWLEYGLTKDQILERYLSKIYFGDGCYGLRAAARHYFDKSVTDLSLAESAFLVAILPSPTVLSNNMEEARKRTRMVIEAMVDAGRIEHVDEDETFPTQFASASTKELGSYFADWVAQSLEVPGDRSFAPLPVQTSFDPKLQRLAEDAVSHILDKHGKRHRVGQAALVAMRPDGRVVAMVGGRDYATSKFNRAVQALRQPGSAFKTFVYFAALRGGADTGMQVNDEPIAIGDYEPKNYGHDYRGAVTLKTAFAASINTVAVRISETVGRNRVIDAARDLGVSTPMTYTPSVALGASEVNLLELTAAYAAIAADAYPVLPWTVTRVGRRNDVAGPPAKAGLWRLEHGSELRSLLSATVQSGTGRAARTKVSAYGKTGTSQDFRDAWFIGFAGNLVVGVWLGNDDNSSMKRVTGGSLPAQIWSRFVGSAIEHDPQFEAKRRPVPQFAAKPRMGSRYAVAWELIETVVEPVYSASAELPALGQYQPRPMMFGYMRRERYERRPQRRRAPRGHRAWTDPFEGG